MTKGSEMLEVATVPIREWKQEVDSNESGLSHLRAVSHNPK
jgi:hypothetical protein